MTYATWEKPWVINRWKKERMSLLEKEMLISLKVRYKGQTNMWNPRVTSIPLVSRYATLQMNVVQNSRALFLQATEITVTAALISTFKHRYKNDLCIYEKSVCSTLRPNVRKHGVLTKPVAQKPSLTYWLESAKRWLDAHCWCRSQLM